MTPLNLGIFASGRGSNFSALLIAIQSGRLNARVRLLLSDNPDAGAIQTAKTFGIPAWVVMRADFASKDLFVQNMLSALEENGVDFIVLAGYLKRIPVEVIRKYPNRIVNIHPALLPSFGGRGMYGHFVHEAVLKQGCKISGVTVHIVDEEYDHGPIVAQRSVVVEEEDNADKLAQRVLRAEHQLYAEAIQLFAEGRVKVDGQKAIILK